MTKFRASKKREKKRETVARGKPLVPSSAISQKYSKLIKAMVREMADDYRSGLLELMAAPGTKQHYAFDAKLPINRFKSFFERMAKKWAKKLNGFSENTAKKMAIEVDKHSFSSVGESLRSLGIKEPKGLKPSTFEGMMSLFVNENVSLVSSVGEEVRSKIERAVWQSLTAESGTEQGAYGIKNAILKSTNIGVDRAELIAMDQTKKLYSQLNNARMEQNRVNKFEWAHSSAGKVPRHTHVELDGKIFSTIGPPSELYNTDGSRVSLPKRDDGKPGYAINCRCRAVPVIDLD